MNDQIQVSDKLYLNFGARYEYDELYSNIAILRSAVNYRPQSGLILKLQYGNAFKNPLLHDNFYYSASLDLRNDAIVDLQRERSNTLEFVVSKTWPAISLDIIAFRSEYNNFISLKSSGLEYYDNTDDIISINGLELVGKYRLFTKLSGYFNATTQSINFAESDQTLLNAPNYSLKGGIIYRLVPQNKLTIAMEAQHYGDTDFEDFENKRPGIDFRQDAFTLINANITSQIISGIDLSLRISNVTAAEYEYTPTKGTFQSYPADGRGYRLQLTKRF